MPYFLAAEDWRLLIGGAKAKTGGAMLVLMPCMLRVVNTRANVREGFRGSGWAKAYLLCHHFFRFNHISTQKGSSGS